MTDTANPSLFPDYAGSVTDAAKIIPPELSSKLQAQIAVYERATTSQMAIVTVPSLDGMAIEDYGYQLGRRWAIGEKGKDNGVLLIVAPNERKVRIEVGYGLEGDLTDADASYIISSVILSSFKAGNIPAGIERGASAMIGHLSGHDDRSLADETTIGDARTNPALVQEESDGTAWMFFAVFMALFGIMFLVGMFLLLRRTGSGTTAVSGSTYQTTSSRSGFRSSFGSGSRRSGGGSFGGGGAAGSW